MLAVTDLAAHIVIVGVFGLVGAALVVVAVFDPRRVVSKAYSRHPKGKLSFWGLSWSPASFRVWLGVFGLIGVGFAVASFFIPVGYHPAPGSS